MRRLHPVTRRGSVLVIVLVTIVFAAMALVAFMDRAMNDLLVDHRQIITQRLRAEAYSGLEVTLAVLHEFRQANSGLRSPAEGWADPLGFAAYTPAEGRVIEITFEDESGKISLPRADALVLSNLFQTWQVPKEEADKLADLLMGWMRRDHVFSTAMTPDYDQRAIPYEPPARPLRSYTELAAIDGVGDFFYDSEGQPNDNWRRFVASVSLFDFEKPNINGARPEALAALGQFDETQRQVIGEYLSGAGQYQTAGPRFFRDAGEAQAIVGQGGNSGAFGTTISALRIVITVREGSSEFRIAAVVTTQNEAKVVQQKATRSTTSAADAQTVSEQQTAPNTQQSSPGASASGQEPAAEQNLRYPFTLLEIRENDEIPAAPPAAVESPL